MMAETEGAGAQYEVWCADDGPGARLVVLAPAERAGGAGPPAPDGDLLALCAELLMQDARQEAPETAADRPAAASALHRRTPGRE